VALNSYGTIMAYAIELEGNMQTFYESVTPLESTFEDYARRCAKRKQRITQVRQEYVTEMVLEPIAGLNIANYELNVLPSTDRTTAIFEARRLEAILVKFYGDTSAKLNVTEAIRTFQKFGQENADRIDELASL
jgi:hypothetical protein